MTVPGAVATGTVIRPDSTPGASPDVLPFLSVMSVHLVTERLDLRPCSIEHLDALYQLWTDTDVRRFLFDGRAISREDAASFIDASEKGFAARGYGLWAFFERGSNEIAGFAGFLVSEDDAPNLMFATHPRLWGRGYARDASTAVIAYAFDTLGLARIVADVDEPNAASVRTLEALGMTRTRRVVVDGRPLLYFERMKDEG
jgi:[ribosomal protein S5]-alanine N-acetyltransferase